MPDDKSTITQKEYWREIANVAKNAKSETKTCGQALDTWRERAFEHVREIVDGHHWIIYTWCYPWVLIHTRNEDALFDQMGDDALAGKTDYSSVMQVMAFAAMLQDAEEALSELFDK
jgi:hypothetical protein